MRGLPPVAPDVMFRNSVRLPRDYYVRVFSNDYSVDPAMIGRVVDVSASLDTISVHHDGVLIAAHCRKWARQLTVTDPAHVVRAAELRTQFQAQRARRPVITAVVETASLAGYDDLFRVDCLAPGLMEVLDHPERLRIMPAMKKYPPELKERAVRLLLAAREDVGGARGASSRIGQQLGIPADTLRKWLLRADIDTGARPGTPTEDAARLLELERENRELRRANAILRSASAFFAAELDRPSIR